jgi:cytochrome c-type biogenesis protein CcmE
VRDAGPARIDEGEDSMTPRQKRMATVAAILVGVGIATAFALQAFDKNMLYYYSPTQILAGEAPDTRSIRVGGLVENGSVQREPGSLEVRFTLTDFANTVGVSYTGVLPDLFREGQGIIARGKLTDQNLFVAEEVLAKHDENYMPPEVKDSLKPHADAAQAMNQGDGT